MLLLIYAYITPEDSISTTIAITLFILCLLSIVAFLFGVARTLDIKNRSFWWFGLFILFPIPGMIVILFLDDHSGKGGEQLQQMR